MSVFSILKRSRQQAKEHAQKRAEQAKSEEAKAPYRHVPTHAAIDALSGAPAGWRQDDRAKILEQNRRRSAMTASGLNMSTPGLPRVSSSLSQVTYPSAYANPMVHNMPRAYSYSGVPPMPTHMPAWLDRGGHVVYSVPHSSAPSIKGKEVERAAMYDSGRASVASNKGSPVDDSSASTSSQDDLEIKPVRPTLSHTSSAGVHPALRVSSAASSPSHRLHPSNSRRASDASLDRPEGGAHVRPVADRRPPPSVRGFSAIPPPASHHQPLHFGSLQGSLAPSAPSVASSGASTASGPSLASFNFSLNSAPTSAHTSANSSISMPSTPSISPYVADSPFVPGSQTRFENVAQGAPAALNPSLKHKDRRVSKMTRFSEMETDEGPAPAVQMPMPWKTETSQEASLDFSVPVSRELSKISSKVSEHSTPVSPAEAEAPLPAKSSKRLTKQPGTKLTKKSRWSTKAAPIAA